MPLAWEDACQSPKIYALLFFFFFFFLTTVKLQLPDFLFVDRNVEFNQRCINVWKYFTKRESSIRRKIFGGNKVESCYCGGNGDFKFAPSACRLP